MELDEIVRFHGHLCPGLALGFRVANCAIKELGLSRSADEELVAVVENKSCAVDAIQMIIGCTAGKGNLIFRDYGKQVYTFFRRSDGQAVRLAVRFIPPPESPEEAAAWARYRAGDESSEVMRLVSRRKGEKSRAILAASDEELFAISRPSEPPPPAAQIHPTLSCAVCGELVMESKTSRDPRGLVCIPCSQKS